MTLQKQKTNKKVNSGELNSHSLRTVKPDRIGNQVALAKNEIIFEAVEILSTRQFGSVSF
jgi:hypothetical protein